MSCPLSEREDDVKDTQQQAVTLTTPCGMSWPKKEREVGRVCGHTRARKNRKVDRQLKLFKMWLWVLGIKTSRQNFRQVINERVKQNI